MFTRDELQRIANELNDYLRENECWEYVYVTYYDDCYQLSADVERGDWKHDHHRIDYLVEKFCIKNHYDIAAVESLTTEEDGTDSYSATHFWLIKELERELVDDDVMYTLDIINDDEALKEEVELYHSDADYDFVMFEYIDKNRDYGFVVDKIKPYTYEVIDSDGDSVELVFDPEWPEYVYTIDGKGPESHSSYEYIASECERAINAKKPLEEGMSREAMIAEINKLNGTNYKFAGKEDIAILAILQKARNKAASKKKMAEPKEDDTFEPVEVKKCEHCGTRLNDGGTCPECDDKGGVDVDKFLD